MQEVKILRLTTGEDVIAKVKQGSGDLVTLNKPFVIIPQQIAADNLNFSDFLDICLTESI